MEIEAVVSNKNLIEQLTPSHLMYDRHLKPPINHDEQIAENISPAMRTKYVISVLHKIWKHLITYI